jgi:hypothetical protein
MLDMDRVDAEEILSGREWIAGLPIFTVVVGATAVVDRLIAPASLLLFFFPLVDVFWVCQGDMLARALAGGGCFLWVCRFGKERGMTVFT